MINFLDKCKETTTPVVKTKYQALFWFSLLQLCNNGQTVVLKITQLATMAPIINTAKVRTEMFADLPYGKSFFLIFKTPKELGLKTLKAFTYAGLKFAEFKISSIN